MLIYFMICISWILNHWRWMIDLNANIPTELKNSDLATCLQASTYYCSHTNHREVTLSILCLEINNTLNNIQQPTRNLQNYLILKLVRGYFWIIETRLRFVLTRADTQPTFNISFSMTFSKYIFMRRWFVRKSPEGNAIPGIIALPSYCKTLW